MVKGTSDRMFIVKCEASMKTLRVWLKDRTFNYHFPYLEDRQGNRMIGLSNVTREGKQDVGIVVIRDHSLLELAVATVKEAMVGEMV